MKLEEALNLLRQVCAGFKGTLQEHQTLQTALQTLQTALQVVEDKSKASKKEKKEGQKK